MHRWCFVLALIPIYFQVSRFPPVRVPLEHAYWEHTMATREARPALVSVLPVFAEGVARERNEPSSVHKTTLVMARELSFS